MWDFDYGGLNPPQKVLFLMLLVTTVSSVLAVLLLVAKLFVEYLTRRDVRSMLKAAHDVMLVDAELRREIRRKFDKVEAVAEGTERAVKKASTASERVVVAAEQIKQAVTPPALPGDPRKTPKPPDC